MDSSRAALMGYWRVPLAVALDTAILWLLFCRLSSLALVFSLMFWPLISFVQKVLAGFSFDFS